MNAFGPHSDVVGEVLEYVRTNNLFRQIGQVDGLKYSIRRLYEFDRLDVDIYRDPLIFDTRIVDWHWCDIKAQSQERILEYLSKNMWVAEEVLPRIRDALTSAFTPMTDRLSKNLPEEEVWSIYDDFVSILTERLAGIEESFMQDMYKLYQSGLYPVGWDGKYPSGNLVVCCWM